MGESSYEARKRPLESELPEQIEVRVRRERRRRWTPADKLRIVEEAFAPGVVVTHVLVGKSSCPDNRGMRRSRC
jgi:hypothetical protein